MKKILSLLIIFVMLFSLASCKKCKKDNDKDNGNNNGVKPEVEVKFWHAMGQANQAIIQEIITNFNKLYPHIKVTQTSLGDYTTLRDTITSGVAADELPTIAQTYPDHVALYLSGQVMQELDSYINSTEKTILADGTETIIGLTEEERNAFIPGFYAEGTIYDSYGTMYSLPFNKSTEVMYYNKTIFDKYGWSAPKTWDDVVTISEAYKTTSEYQALIKGGKKTTAFSSDSEANLFITLTQQWGGEYTKFDENGKGVYAFDNAKSKEALAFYQEQFKKGNFATATHFGANYSSDAFTAGNIIMTIGSSAGASYNVPKNGAFEVGVCAYPQKDMSNPQVIQQGTNVSLFDCANEKEELAGWLFIKFLTNYESALLWCTSTAYFPIRTDVLNSDEYADHISGIIRDEEGNEFVKPNTQQLAQKVGLEQQTWFYTNVAFKGSSLARDNVESVVQAILYGGKTIDKAYEEALNALLYS